MTNKKSFLTLFINYFVIIALTCLVILFFPWHRINWGQLQLAPDSYITVTGHAQQDVLPQIAHFTAGVTITNDNKQVAVQQVNDRTQKIIQQLKDFGIPDKDIQTQTVSVHQYQDQPKLLRPDIAPESDLKWRARNSITIILRDINQASQLATLLQQTPATNTSGPRFSLDDTKDTKDLLLSSAVDDARSKAKKLAQAGDRRLGQVITINEQDSRSYPRPMFGIADKDTSTVPVQPGTETVNVSVTVTFALK